MKRNVTLLAETKTNLNRWFGLLAALFYAFSSNAADLVNVLPVKDNIIMLQFDEGHVDYNGIPEGGNYKTGPFESQGDNVNYYSALDQNAASNTSNYRISSSDDANYSTFKIPQHIGVKRKGQDFSYETFIVHDFTFYLKLPNPLVKGKTYTIELLNGIADNTTSYTFTFNPFKLHSPTIHINQVGFTPDQPKFAYLSQWMGTYNYSPDNNGALDLSGYTNNTFYIYDIENNTVAKTYTSGISLQKSAGPTIGNYNWTHADVYQCDFSDFTTAGKYILVVEDLGCSYPFEIDNDIYRKPFYTAMRGLFYQRSGIVKIADEFGQKLYPRDHHAGDGTKIYYDPNSTNMVAKYEAKDGAPAFIFDESKRIDHIIQFTGHYHDAGDWDYYNRHYIMPLTLMLLYDYKPENFGDSDLNNKIRYSEGSSTINESGNGIPDLLDEAAWMVNMYKRVKDAIKNVGGTGGVPGWIGPDAGATNNPSWADTRNVGIKAELPNPTFAYAANAAYYSYALAKAKTSGFSAIRQADIDMWKQEAIDAWNWAEMRHTGFSNERQLAAVCLYLVTQNSGYQTEFKNQFENDNTTGWMSWDSPRAYVIASGIYLNSCKGYSNLDQTFYDNVKNNIVSRANSVTDNSFLNDYRVGGLQNGQTNSQSLITTPRTIYMAIAYEATGDQKYMDAMHNTVAYYLGGNQENEVRMGGIGDKAEESAFKPDFWYLVDYNSKVYRNPSAIGIPVYGAVWSWWWFFDFGSDKPARRTTIPQIADDYSQSDDTWPRGELRMNNRYSIEGSEFTINENCTWNIFAYGYLADNSNGSFIPNQPPTVSLNLNEGQELDSDAALLTVNASNDTRFVEYYYEWHLIGRSYDKLSGFPITWDSPISSGSVQITAVAYDDEGLQSLPSDAADAQVNIASDGSGGSDEGSVTISNINRSAYQVATLTTGVEYYIDRNYTVTGLPTNLDGEIFLRTANNDKSLTGSNFITFDVDVDCDIYIAYDQRSSAPVWLNDWGAVSETIDVTDAAGSLKLYKKTHLAGQVSLGDNGGAGSMYIVIIVPVGSNSDCGQSLSGTMNIEFCEPITGQTYVVGEPIVIKPNFTSDIVQIKAWHGNWKFIGGSQVHPFEITWADAPAGVHELTIRGEDAFGNKTAGKKIQIEISDDVTVDWTESFSGISNGSTADNGSTAWNTAYSGSGSFDVQNEEITSQGLGAEAIWQSESIDITGSVDISADIKSGGPMENWQDYIRVFYSVDGGAEILFAERVGNFNNNNPETVSVTGITGSTVRITVKINNSGNDEFYYLDNISVVNSDTKSGMTLNRENQNITNKLLVNIYPNPLYHGQLNIDVNGEAMIHILDLTGRTICMNRISRSIQTNQLSNGTYIFKITNGVDTIYQKVIINK